MIQIDEERGSRKRFETAVSNPGMCCSIQGNRDIQFQHLSRLRLTNPICVRQEAERLGHAVFEDRIDLLPHLLETQGQTQHGTHRISIGLHMRHNADSMGISQGLCDSGQLCVHFFTHQFQEAIPQDLPLAEAGSQWPAPRARHVRWIDPV